MRAVTDGALLTLSRNGVGGACLGGRARRIASTRRGGRAEAQRERQDEASNQLMRL